MKPNEILIWIFTVIAAFALIGGAMFYVKRQQAMNTREISREMPVAQPTPQLPKTLPSTPEPETAAFIETHDSPPAPVPQEPVSLERHQLDLSNIAGQIELDIPFMRIRNKMPLHHTCFQENVSPAINWAKAPEATKSYIVFMERRDKGWQEGDEGFVTWILFNIPENAGGVRPSVPKSSTLPDGSRHATSDHNTVGYVGPCEAMGKFNYAIRVFALDKVLDSEPNTAKYDLIKDMNGHIIDAAEVEFIHYRRF